MATPLQMPTRRTLTARPSTNDVISQIHDLEQRAAQSARHLETAARVHHRHLNQLAAARRRAGLPTLQVTETGDLVVPTLLAAIIGRPKD